MYYLRRLALLTILLTSLFIVILPAHAGNATVSTCDFASLQTAVTTANTGGGIITFSCSGTITFTSQLTITDNVTINENSNTVIFDGGNSTRHFTVNSGASLTLSGFTLQNGSVSGDDGGSIYNAGTFVGNSLVFLSNGGTLRGGAIYTTSTSSTTLNTSTFSGNTAEYAGAIHSYGTTIVNASAFSGNTALIGAGAIYNQNGTLNISAGTSFTSNQASYGGAIYAYTGTTTIIGASFMNNISTIDTTIGAIQNEGSSIGSQNTTYTGNTCGGSTPITDNGGNTRDAASVGCPGTVLVVPVVPVAPVVLSPDTTALGCTVTADVEAFGMTDNTYCRLLMKNGGVIKFPGAVPQNLINLGVILAVDVYRLQGGQSITDFGGYSRICLAGEGRLFYLDARTSPRAQVELATESLDGMTCGWIPAAGTLVLTK